MKFLSQTTCEHLISSSTELLFTVGNGTLLWSGVAIDSKVVMVCFLSQSFSDTWKSILAKEKAATGKIKDS